jgi:hypothetical protein
MSLNSRGGHQLLWRNNANGDLIAWQMSGGQIAAVATIANAPVTYAVADSHGDYNGDGQNDILLRGLSDGMVVDLLMNGVNIVGDGFFGVVPTTTVLLSGHQDYNGDGKSDLRWEDLNNANFISQWTMNGLTSTPGNVFSIAIGVDVIDSGDFSGDGKSDLILWNRDFGTAAFYTLNGHNPTFVASYSNIPLALTIADAQGDFNADGKSDVLWRNHGSGDVVEWIMTPNGVGSVATLANVPLNLSIVDAHGDYNHDGMSDILWRNTQSGEVVEWVMLNGQIAGVRSFGTVPLSFTILDGHSDFNGDGTSDILWRDGASGRTALWVMNGAQIAGVNDFGAIPTYLSLSDPGEKGITVVPAADGTYFGTVGNNTFYLNAHFSTFTGGAGENVYVVQNLFFFATITDFKPNLDRFELDHAVFTNFTPGNLPAANFVVSTTSHVPANAPTGDYIVADTTDNFLVIDHHVQNGNDNSGVLAIFSHPVTLSANDFLII